MKKIILTSIIASMALFATNGDNLISLGSKSRALGGTGIANFIGAENIISNPALLSEITKREFNINLIHFTPDVKTDGVTSKSDRSFIPNISFADKLNDKVSYGFGVFGSAGMGVDYEGNKEQFYSYTNLELMKIAPSISYSQDKWAFGLTPIIQRGTLKIAFETKAGKTDNGISSDWGHGYELGTTFKINSQSKIGLVYKSKIDMKYNKQISSAARSFGYADGVFSDHLEQPEEYGIGYSIEQNNITLALDYKSINWSKAKGYKDFKWEDQKVYSVGLKYENDKQWFALGYNYAKSPIKEVEVTDRRINTFNYLMFPATSQTHYTIGTGYRINKNLSLGLSIVYATNSTNNIAGLKRDDVQVQGSAPTTLKSEHSELSESLSIKYTF